ncbi:DUF2637 domain-containing protein [Planosporangium flavigriseum]|uniref:DUF2637 domain-containing protein n=1 Tax=Planosporangium flavigriseum TaxID=373681 RepID=A0A8J3PLM4_9ACTN|nr:DUF2637 domain-containing protein [Planosporangium flavigriseum]NJC63943.1 DUF2637 domain-containing protein [Planosporangium flavigriseum]GIG74656.1 hypothetical protein Pfl04_30600 [Planosporangium flavigriseum]
MPLPQLQRIRWAVRSALALGVAASVAANILHAQPNPVSQVIAAWPPLALLLTVELISRIPVHRRSLAAVRIIATSTIAGIAAWVSYWHMVGVAARYGETGPSPYLLPLSVDGLIVVASVSLVELAGRIRTLETAAAEAGVEVTADNPAEAVVEVTADKPAEVETVIVEPATVEPATVAVPDDAQPKRSPARRASQPRATKTAPAKATKAAPRKRATTKATSTTAAPTVTAPAVTAPAVTAPAETPPVTPRPVGRDLPAAELLKLAEQLKAERPGLTQAAIAGELGVTTHRLQQAKRQAVAA